MFMLKSSQSPNMKQMQYFSYSPFKGKCVLFPYSHRCTTRFVAFGGWGLGELLAKKHLESRELIRLETYNPSPNVDRLAMSQITVRNVLYHLFWIFKNFACSYACNWRTAYYFCNLIISLFELGCV